MSTPFYDLASLVVVPSGYKSGKIYAQKPLTTDGQLTFTRSNDTATRVASNGLIERVRTNLILQSNSFSDAAWVKLGVGTGTAPVLTANYTTDPFGGNNAWRLQCDLNGGTASGDRSWIYQTFAGSPSNGTLSIYVKLNSAGSVNLVFSDGAGDTQTVTSTTWVRLNIPSAAIGEFRLGLIGYNGTDTCDLSIAFSQVEAGDIATDTITTLGTAVSVGPVANVPRLDYSGGSSCPRLLLEPQRTNLITSSEDFTASLYNYISGIAVTKNQTTSPDGYNNADLITEDSTSGAHRIGIATNIGSAGLTTTMSVFAKANGRDWLLLSNANMSPSGSTYFNIAEGYIGINTAIDAKIEDYGNGWYRCSITYEQNKTNPYPTIYLTNASGVSTYQGDGTSGVYLYGYQIEQSASYATSYIPTLGSASTRGSDAASKTGISSLIGQTEGTLFVEAEYPREPSGAAARKLISVNDGSSNNLVDIYVTSGLNTLTARLRAGATGFGSTGTSSVPLGNVKIAYAYKANDYALYINGTLIQAVTTGGAFTFSSPVASYQIGDGEDVGDELGGGIKQALLFKTRLSNADLAALTA
jgi:hypothetical protein